MEENVFVNRLWLLLASSYKKKVKMGKPGEPVAIILVGFWMNVSMKKAQIVMLH